MENVFFSIGYQPAGQNKASHFHCLKCDFVCTDTNKVVAHRRQHQKLDSIMAAGFEKFTPSQNCNVSKVNNNAICNAFNEKKFPTQSES